MVLLYISTIHVDVFFRLNESPFFWYIPKGKYTIHGSYGIVLPFATFGPAGLKRWSTCL